MTEEKMSARDVIRQLSVDECNELIADLEQELKAAKSLLKVAEAKEGNEPARRQRAPISDQGFIDKVHSALSRGPLDFNDVVKKTKLPAGKLKACLSRVPGVVQDKSTTKWSMEDAAESE